MADVLARIQSIDWAAQLDNWLTDERILNLTPRHRQVLYAMLGTSVANIVSIPITSYDELVEASYVSIESIQQYSRSKPNFVEKYFSSYDTIRRSLSAIYRRTTHDYRSMLVRRSRRDHEYRPDWPIFAVINQERADKRRGSNEFCSKLALASGNGVRFSCYNDGDVYTLNFSVDLPDQESCMVAQDRLLEMFSTFVTIAVQKG